jgi:hypothetical protein
MGVGGGREPPAGFDGYVWDMNEAISSGRTTPELMARSLEGTASGIFLCQGDRTAAVAP